MDIRVCCVNESYYVWILQKGMLEAEFMENVQGLLERYELKRRVHANWTTPWLILRTPSTRAIRYA